MASGYVLNCIKRTEAGPRGEKGAVLRFSGRQFFFPFGEVTEVPDQTFAAPDLRRQFNESNPEEGAMFRRDWGGLELAKKMLDRHHLPYTKIGFWVGSQPPSDKAIRETEQAAHRYKLNRIAQAKKERHDRLAGGPGRIEMEDEVLGWMEELGIEDEIYLPSPKQPAASPTLPAGMIQQIVTETVSALSQKQPAGDVAVVEPPRGLPADEPHVFESVRPAKKK